MEPFEAAEDVAGVGGRDEQRRGGDAEGALDHDVPHAPEAVDRERQTEHIRTFTAADERQEEREREERQLDDETASKRRQRDLGDERDCGEHRRVDAERPERLARRGHHGDDEQHRRRDLALGCHAVDGAVAVHRQRPVLTGTHQGPAGCSGEGPERRRTMNQTPPNSAAATTNVIVTPMMPESPVLTLALSTLRTA